VTMKTQTKVLSVCIITLLIIYGIARQSHCENLELSDTSAEINQTVVFELTINNAPNTVSVMGLDISYNPDILAFQSYEKGELASRFDFFNLNENSDGIVRIGGLSSTANKIQKGESGLLIKLSFNVLSYNSTALELLNLEDHIQGWSIKEGIFTTTPILPTIETIFPTHAYTTGGGVLHITGTNFQEGVTISIGNSTQLTTTYDSASHIYCEIPSHEAGYAAIIVANPDGNGITLNETFLYEIDPNQPTIIDKMNWISTQLSEQKILPPEDITHNEMFGSSVAISGNFAIVGAKSDDDKQGSAYILEKTGTGWRIVQKIVSEFPKEYAYMGLSVAITDEFAFVGEINFDADEENIEVGTVYVYQYQASSGKWEKSQQLLPDTLEGTHRFGTSMSVFEDTLVIGAYGNTEESGKAFVFQREGSQWNQVQCLEPEESIINGRFGKAVNIFSDYIIVGAYIENSYLGGAYIFQKINGSWHQTAKLTPPDAHKYSYFGYSVDINNSFAIVGAYGFEMNDINDTGAVYIFKQTETGLQRTTNSWNLAYTITENNLEKRDKFGIALQLEGNILAVGATKNSSSDSGTVYFYKLIDTNATKIKELRASDAQIDANFGRSIALHRNHLIIGADLYKEQDKNTGSVYFFEPLNDANPDNDAPVSFDQTVETEINEPIEIALFASDVDNENLTYILVSNPRFGKLKIDANIATYTPSFGFKGRDNFEFKAHDDALHSNVATIEIWVGVPVIDPPVFSPPDETHAPVQVSIHCDTPDALIYYTLDGSDPNETSMPYSGTIDIVKTTEIKAIAIKPGMRNSRIVQAYYKCYVDKAIIATGGWPDDFLWDATINCANYAYRALRYRGYSKSQLYYLRPYKTIHADDNGNPRIDIDDKSTNAQLEYAITSWASDAKNLIVYLIDHGGPGNFWINDKELLYAKDLNSWLDIAQSQIPGKIFVLYEACYSGSFLKELKYHSTAESRRIIITSSENDAYFLVQGTLSFSYQFWAAIYDSPNVYNAFNQAMTMMQAYQTPLLDADGDGIGNEKKDGLITRDLTIGNDKVTASTRPKILLQQACFLLNNQTSQTMITKDIISSHPIQKVWAVISPPVQQSVATGTPILSLPEIEMNETLKKGQFSGTYSDFTENGVYTVSIYARHDKGAISLPAIIHVFSGNISQWKGDINMDQVVDLSDVITGLQILSDISSIESCGSVVSCDGNDMIDMKDVLRIFNDVGK